VFEVDQRLSENLYDKIYRKKNALIQQFVKGDLSKREFLIANFELIQNMNMKPFNNIDCFAKGFFNYQYYNTLAKYYRMEAEEAKNNMKHPEVFKEYVEKSDYFYSRKDKTILRVLEVIDFKNVDAYYIKVKSPFLKNKLIEIVFRDYDDVIFHTKGSWLVERLLNEGILCKGEKKSLIDLYINQKY
jgi:hypothetical protein